MDVPIDMYCTTIGWTLFVILEKLHEESYSKIIGEQLTKSN